ncbi:ABC transporter permease subunit [Candidatus Solincola tengchongensis]|uniref:ABC transporter permease n=1 Tax=Candidatus Solincola tengchongensis TaxID=2900693 RepID=UPI0025794BBB|nr:ABC transporter permease subunit [Candidatus Solincola tengchongensis]
MSKKFTDLLTVAWGVVQDAVHRKVFYAVLAFTVILIFLVPMLPSAEVGVQLDLAREASLGLVSIMAFILATVMGSNILSGEMRKRTIYNTLSRPVSRKGYFIGKYLGILAVLAVSLIVAYLVILALVGVKFGVFSPGLVKAVFAIFLEAAVLAAVAMLASVHLSPVVCILITGLFYVVCHVKGDFLYRTMTDSGHPAVLRGMAGLAYYLLPNLERLNINETVAHGERVFRVGAVEFLLLLGLAATFVVIFLVLGAFILERKDL